MKKFYKTTLLIEIVSDGHIEWDDINDIALEGNLNVYRVASNSTMEISEQAATAFCNATTMIPYWLGIENKYKE
jgi:hypothetical protein